MAGGEGLPEAHEPDEIVGLDDATGWTPRALDASAGGAALIAFDARIPLPSPLVHENDDMISCMSDSDDFDDMMSCVSALDDPSISDCDTAANGPAQVGDPGADAPKVHVDPSDPAQLLAADAPPGGTRNEEATPMSAAALVSGISERFGQSAADATLLSAAAAGCPNEGERTPSSPAAACVASSRFRSFVAVGFALVGPCAQGSAAEMCTTIVWFQSPFWWPAS